MTKRITAATLAKAKAAHEKSVWLTAYDATSATLAEDAGVDVLLVGDSLGNTILGYDSTIPVTIDQMIHHTSAVVRGRQKALVVCDLPFGSYQQSKEQAFETSVRVLQQTGCDAVKLEGGVPMAETIRFLSDRGIAVVAHIGLTPQSVKKFGSFRRRGNNPAEYESILADARAVADAGAIALVIECVPDELTQAITDMVSIPTVGIGAGSACDAQVLVWHDLLGLSENPPPFATAYTNLREQIGTAISAWCDDVRQGSFPKP